MVIGLAMAIPKANKVALLLGTNISLPPTVPFITWASYEIGRSVLRNGLSPLRWIDFKHITWSSLGRMYVPLVVGGVILGALCGVLFYFLTFFVARRIKKAKHNVSTRQYRNPPFSRRR